MTYKVIDNELVHISSKTIQLNTAYINKLFRQLWNNGDYIPHRGIRTEHLKYDELLNQLRALVLVHGGQLFTMNMYRIRYTTNGYGHLKAIYINDKEISIQELKNNLIAIVGVNNG